MDADRRSFIFGATLSEIGFILFFALLLFAFFQRGKDLKMIDEGRDEAARLLIVIEARTAALAELEKVMDFKTEAERDRFFSELVPRKQLAAENDELLKKNEDLQSKLELFDDLQQQIDDAADGSESLEEKIAEALD